MVETIGALLFVAAVLAGGIWVVLIARRVCRG